MLENVRPYRLSLIIYRKPPPIPNGRIDWTTTGQACGIEDELDGRLEEATPTGTGCDYPVARSATNRRALELFLPREFRGRPKGTITSWFASIHFTRNLGSDVMRSKLIRQLWIDDFYRTKFIILLGCPSCAHEVSTHQGCRDFVLAAL